MRASSSPISSRTDEEERAISTEELAGFATGLRYRDLPAPVAEKAKEIILHSLGVQLAASTVPWSRLIYRYGQDQGGTPRSTIVNYGLRTSPANAAYVNGAFAHGFELDDNHSRTSVKGGCVAVPAALAVGEDQSSSGQDVITAVVAGFEVMLRTGLAIRPGVMGRGGHPTGSSGAFGAAAVASKLLGLGALTTAYALGSAGTNIVGLSEIPAGGRGHLKRTFGGAAAAAGIRAAQLAAAGLTGPLTTLDPEASGAEHSARIPSLRQLTPDEVDEKFTTLATSVLPADQCATIRDTVRSLEALPDVSALMPLLVAPGS